MMNRSLRIVSLAALLAMGEHSADSAAAGAPPKAVPDPVFLAVQLLREGGCGGLVPAARPLERSALLDRTAEGWASGRTLQAAADAADYRAAAAAGVHLSGPASSIMQTLRRSDCTTLTNRRMRDIGVFHRGTDTWIVLAARDVGPGPGDSPRLAARALDLVNAARLHGSHCGTQWFAPAPPVRLSMTLDQVALGHASDMAEHGYFEHADLAGRSPADRVRAIGYRETLVGENIAYGVRSADDAVQGWLDSPEHCENIMDPRFAEMGIGFAQGRAARHGLYWVQVLAAPRA